MKDNAKRLVLINASVLIAVFLAGWFLLSYVGGKIEERAVQVVELRTLIARRLQADELLASFKNVSSEAAAYRQKMDLLLPTADQLLDFPKNLDGLRRAEQVTMSFAFQGTQTSAQGGQPGYVGFSLDVSGSLENILHFLDSVESTNPRFLTHFDGFDITALGGDNYRLVAQGRTFFK